MTERINRTGIIVLAVAVSLLAAFYYKPMLSETTRSTLPKHNRMITVLHDVGTIEALHETIILSKTTGEIEWITQDGTLVSPGDPLVRFNNKSLLDDVERCEAVYNEKLNSASRANDEIASVRERYKLMIRQQELNLALALLEQKRVQEMPAPEDKIDSELTLKSATLERQRSELETGGYLDLARRGFVSEATLNRKLLELASKRMDEAIARQVNDLICQGASAVERRKQELAVADAEKELEIKRFNAEAEVAICQANLKVTESGCEHSKHDLERAKQDLDWATVRAPVAGHAVFKDIYKGSSKSMGPPQIGETRMKGWDLCTICDTSNLRVRIYINEADIQYVALNQHATVHLQALPGKVFDAVVTKISGIAVDKNVALSSIALKSAGEAFVSVVQVMLDFKGLSESDRAEMGIGFTADVYINVQSVDSVKPSAWP